MSYISVKAVEGRVARVSPNGEFIPSDRFVSAQETAYLRRLIDFHGDVIVEKLVKTEEAVAAPSAFPASKKE